MGNTSGGFSPTENDFEQVCVRFSPDGPITVAYAQQNAAGFVQVVDVNGVELSGATVVACDVDDLITHSVVLCDDRDQFVAQFLRVFEIRPDGTIRDFDDYTLDGSAAYTPVGTVVDCVARDPEMVVLCDDNGPFIRRFIYDQLTRQFAVTNSTLNGGAYTPSGTVEVCEPETALSPVKFCFDEVIAEETEQVTPGRGFTMQMQHNPGFEVIDVELGSGAVPLHITWSPIDTDASSFMFILARSLETAIPGSSVSVTPVSGTTIDICDPTTPSFFQITIACMNPEFAPPFVLMRHDSGRDEVVNAGFAITDYSNPNGGTTGQEWHAVDRQSDGGRLFCSDETVQAPYSGWHTQPTNNFELWPRWAGGGGPQAGNGGNFTYFDVTPTPRATNVIELNGAINEGIFWQTISIDQAGQYRLEAVVGGRGETQEIRFAMFPGVVDPTSTAVLPLEERTVEAANVIGRTDGNMPGSQNLARFPWTTVADTFNLPIGDYTFVLYGPDTGTSSGGLFTDLRVYRNDHEQEIMQRVENCTYTRTIPEQIERHCQWWQPRVNDQGIVDRWRSMETANREITNDSFWSETFWANQPETVPPGCCDPLPEVNGEEIPPADPPTTPSVFLTEPICGVIGGVASPMLRRILLTPGGFIDREWFIGRDGALVSPSSWQPGDCDDISHYSYVELVDNTTFNLAPGLLQHSIASWSIYARTGPVEVQVNGGTPVVLLTGESLDMDATPGRQTRDEVFVDTTGGGVALVMYDGERLL